MEPQPWLDAGVPRPRGWPRGPCTRGPGLVALDQDPDSPRGPWLRVGARRALALCTLCSVRSHGPSGLPAPASLSPPLASSLCGLWRSTLTPALSAARGGPCSSAPTCQLTAQAGPWDRLGPSAHSPGPMMPPAPPVLGALGQQLSLCPTWALDQAKASRLVTMQRLPKEAPWVARWALTGPPKSLTCWL